jgi:membrane protein
VKGFGPTLWRVTREAGQNWSIHKDSRQGAALAYYSIFSIGPLIVIAIAIAGFFFGRSAVNGEVASSIKDLLGDTGANAIQAMLADAGRPREGIIATCLGLGALFFAAIGLVIQLKDALNIVWEVEPPQSTGIKSYIRSYLLSFAGVLALGFLLMASMIVTTVLVAVGKYVASAIEPWVLPVVSMLASFMTITVLFAMMFKWMPDAPIEWYDVWFGALVTAALFEIGKFIIGFYIGRQGLESTYGAASSVVIVLIWVYYSSQIILMGAEITHAFALHQGSIKNRRAEVRERQHLGTPTTEHSLKRSEVTQRSASGSGG